MRRARCWLCGSASTIFSIAINSRKWMRRKEKENDMATPLRKNDPEKARQYFADKMAFTTGPVEVSNNLKQGTDMIVVDVREPEDYRKGHVPGAFNLPYDRWSTLQGLNKDKL